MVWEVSILNFSCGQEGVQKFEICYWFQISCPFRNQKNSAVEVWGVDVLNSFWITLVHHLLKYAV